MKLCKYLCLISSLYTFALTAQAVEICGRLNQGELIFGRADFAAGVYHNAKEIATTSDGIFMVAFGRDETKDQLLSVIDTSDQEHNFELKISPTQWNIQNIKGIPPRKVTPSDADLAAIQKESKLLGKALKAENTSTFWRSGFIRPVEGRISGEFGGQRIMNKVPKSPHRGMDIAAPAGTPVKASADGVITLTAPDLFYSGNVVVIDHGFGLQTIYAHLSEIKAVSGQTVKQGDIIGLVGKTGRATGPHLHWGASLRNIRFNPQSLLDINSNAEKCFTL
ncbi:MAG: M23 family metallopeptidase [Alphaproteobacteria bacterium]|nr:M23 family metallopeptidase [Alphaproteobacteria bacterium]MBQ9236190.1 M23 family metallopeptidase [Alphaproteobacteria bacterium]